jgi:hypothetical protein
MSAKNEVTKPAGIPIVRKRIKNLTQLPDQHSSQNQPSQDVGQASKLDQFTKGISSQMRDVATRHDGTVDKSALDFLFSVILQIAPRDPLERMIAAQLAVVHLSAMRCAAHLNNSVAIDETNGHQNALNKFLRSFAALLDALRRGRPATEKNIRVLIHDGAQAIVETGPIATSETHWL